MRCFKVVLAVAVATLAVMPAVTEAAQVTSNVISEEKDGYTLYTVDWKAVDAQYEDVKEAKCGDRVVFRWADDSTQNVGVAPDGVTKDSKRCTLTHDPTEVNGFEFVLDDRLSGPNGSFPIAAEGEVYFTTTVDDGERCKNGQVIEFYVCGECSPKTNCVAKAGNSAVAAGNGLAALVAAVMGAGVLLLFA